MIKKFTHPKSYEDLDSALQKARTSTEVETAIISDTNRLLDDPDAKKKKDMMRSSGLDRKLKLYESLKNDQLLRERAEEGLEDESVHSLDEVRRLCIELGFKFLSFTEFNCPISLEEEVSESLVECAEKIGIDFNSFDNKYEMKRFYVMAPARMFKEDQEKYDLDKIKEETSKVDDLPSEIKNGFAIFCETDEPNHFVKPYQYGKIYTKRNAYLAWADRNMMNNYIVYGTAAFVSTLVLFSAIFGPITAFLAGLVSAFAVPSIRTWLRHKNLSSRTRSQEDSIKLLFHEKGWNKI